MIKFRTRLEFRPVRKSDADIKLLFELLLLREHNISHEEIPDFEDHINFVRSAPYRAWYLIYRKNIAVGTFYIKYDNSIGINFPSQRKSEINEIIEFIKLKYLPNEPIKSMVPNFFYVNLPSSAHDVQSVMRELGHKEIQRSYKI